MKRRLPLLLFMLLVFGACQSDLPQAPVSLPEPEQHQHCDETIPALIGSGDELQLVFHTAPELSRTVRVRPDGNVYIPYSDPIPASGQPLEAVHHAIVAAMTSELRDPDIDVFLISAAPRTDDERNPFCATPE